MDGFLFPIGVFPLFLSSVFRPRNTRPVGLIEAKSVGSLPNSRPNVYYPSNRPPLSVSPLVKLPIGAIEPRGWLLSQLKLMKDGLTGRLAEISPFLKDDSGWLLPKNTGGEEVPYWLRGYADLGYLLKDPTINKQSERWFTAILRSQQRDGYFGPANNRAGPDLWPNMIMLAALRSFHEATADRLVLSFMSRYFQFLFHLPVEDLLKDGRQKFRGGENLESVFWLYNRTGESYLLDLAKRLFAKTSDWVSPILSDERDRNWQESGFYQGVNIAMGFRYPAIYNQVSRDSRLLESVEKNYRELMDLYGQQPGGMFAADENIRPAKRDPRQGAETCSIVEFMASFESLLKITGDPVWADRCEEVAFNSLPAALTQDWGGLHYLTAANLISCDSSDEHDFQSSGTRLSYDARNYRCCQHNVSSGWPYFAEHLWMATADNGLAAVMYSPSVVTAILVGSTRVLISEDTDYPFGGRVVLTISLDRPSEFPLYLRIPGWAESAGISVNGIGLQGRFPGGRFVLVKKLWRHGDQVGIDFPVDLICKTWDLPERPVSVRRGPLWLSLKIDEKWKRYGGTDAWPAYEILPASPWNYALIIDKRGLKESLRTVSVTSLPYQPFSADAAPLRVTVKAKRIPRWRTEGKMAGTVPDSPVAAGGKADLVELIPMGCARLRISSFPTAGKGRSRKKPAP